jgi:membrane protease YdiL (CAAX protease family)
MLVWLGMMRIVPAEPGNWGEAAVRAAAMLAPAALTEELTFRGYALTLLQRAWGSPVAIAVTSIAFGFVHLLNPGVTLQSVAMVALAGVFLAIVRLAFDSLWSAWLAHFAYNFVQLAVFHTAVSGLALPQPGYRAVATGPAWLTGGAWGPEAGVAAAFGMLVVSFLLAVHAGWVRVHRRGWRFAIDVRPHGRREP